MNNSWRGIYISLIVDISRTLALAERRYGRLA